MVRSFAHTVLIIFIFNSLLFAQSGDKIKNTNSELTKIQQDIKKLESERSKQKEDEKKWEATAAWPFTLAGVARIGRGPLAGNGVLWDDHRRDQKRIRP